jgi:hypothetical protein
VHRYLRIAAGELILRVISRRGGAVPGEAPDGAESPAVPCRGAKNRHSRQAREPWTGTAAAQLAGDPPGGTARELGRQPGSHVSVHATSYDVYIYDESYNSTS